MNTLLIPTDFSPVANNAIKYAMDMAIAYKLDVSLLHVVLLSTPSVSNVVYIDVATDFQKEAEEHMAFYVNTLKEKYPSLNFTYKVETGLFLDSLKRSCDDLSPVAIVMGIIGIGSTFDKLIGSNTILAMRSVACPLIVVPRNGVFKEVGKLCVACDLQHVANSTPLLAIKTFAKLFDAQVHILNVDYDNRHFTANTPDELNVLNLMFDNVDAKFHFVENENVPDAINDFIEREKIDMLIMLPKKHSFVESLFKKSQTKEMLYQSHIPMLALHQA